MKLAFRRAVWLPPLLSFAGLTLVLELGLGLAEIPSYLMPRPSEVFMALYVHGAELTRAILRTTLAASAGLLASTLLGVVAAILLSSNDWMRRAFYPYAVFFQTVPIIAIAPLLVIWFGYGLKTIIAVSFIVSVFPIIANTLSGLLSTDPALRDLFRLHQASGLTTLVKLRIPGAVPRFLTGLRIASGLAVIGAIVGEFVADDYRDGGGIGTLVMVSIKELKTDKVFAAVLMASLLGLVFFALINLISRLTLRYWHIAETRE
ncbi:MAG TPA: ABC transporter permease [Chromatiaceae bacterium]|nr:ABC transporter permease [Chromatiaceae bacterium]